MEKQTKKQVAAPISLNLSHKTNELKNIKSIFKKKQLDDFIIDKLEEIIRLQNFINIDNLESI